MARLEELFTEQRDGVLGLMEFVANPPDPVREPLGLITARNLLEAALAAAPFQPGRSAEELAVAVNLLYESALAAIDLVKCHTESPRVPQRRVPKDPAP